MRFKGLFVLLFLSLILNLSAQESKMKKFKQLSPSEKCWVVLHPFVAKKALKITEETRKIVQLIIKEKVLKGNGNGGQVDAFRHTFWMAKLSREIGYRKALKLGKAHEKGNYREYKKHRLEDGVIPDKISSEMDLFNNNVGIEIGKRKDKLKIKHLVIETVLKGKCKVIKKDAYDNFLDCDGNYLSKESLQGKWENNKCLVNSDK